MSTLFLCCLLSLFLPSAAVRGTKEATCVLLPLPDAGVAVPSNRHRLLGRQAPPASLSSPSSQCPRANQTLCSSDFPVGFCCESGQTCLSLAGGTTRLCCPTGTCEMIYPRPCNVDYMDVEKHPEAPVVSTALDYKLPLCGVDGATGSSTCCPFGYSCDARGTACVKDADQSSLRAEKSAAVFVSGAAAAAAAITPTPTPTPTFASASAVPAETQGSLPMPTAVGITVGSAAAAAAAGALLAVLCYRHPRTRRLAAAVRRRLLLLGTRGRAPPPVYNPYPFDLEKCRHVPRRKTVPPPAREPAAALPECGEPVELPAEPVPAGFWRAPRRGALLGNARSSTLLRASRPPPQQQREQRQPRQQRRPHPPDGSDMF